MRIIAAFLAILLSASCVEAGERWAVYYGHELPAERFASFDVVVLDADYIAPVAALKKQGKTVLGYLSLGEAENYRPYFKQLKDKRLLLGSNPAWPDHYVIDIRQEAWTEMVIHTLMPDILNKEFDGVMFDTIDSPMHLGHKTPQEQQEMQQAAITLICAVRDAYPDMKIMLNRGFDVLTSVAPCIDMLLAESTHTELNLPASKEPQMVPEETRIWYLGKLKDAQQVNPRLKIYTLDYWPLKDVAGVKNIYAIQRGYGFIPYVSSMDLQSIYTEQE